MEQKETNILDELEKSEYKYGFTTDIETEVFPKGLDESIVRMISQRKNEPRWLLEMRLKAYRHWQTMSVPEWAHLDIPAIDFQDIIYFASPKKSAKSGSADDIDPELKRTLD